MDTVLYVLLAAIAWFLYSISQEIRIIRLLTELPESVASSYKNELNEIEEKIKIARVTVLVSPTGDEPVYKLALRELEKEREEILERRRRHLVSK